MPIYEYRCRSCGKTFEHLHRRLGERSPACPYCGFQKVEKQFSTFSPGKGESGRGDDAPACARQGTCSSKCPAAGLCGLS